MSINRIIETGGAGDEGTDELVQKLQQDTPGQPTKRKPKMKKFRDILEGVDPIQENVNKESKLLAKEINDAARRETGGDKKDFQQVAKLISYGKLKDAAKYMAKLDTVVLEDLVTFVMGHESVFKAMYPKARAGQYVASFARKVEGHEKGDCEYPGQCGQDPCVTFGKVDEEEISERVHYAFDTQDGAREFGKKVAGMPMNIVRVGSGKYYVVELRPGANQGVQDKAAKIAVSIGLSEEFYNIAEGYIKPTTEVVQEAMSERDKKKRLAMIKNAVEKMNKQNMEKAKKDALAMMKASGMFDEELEEVKKAPKIKHLNIYGSEISGLRSGTKYYTAMALDMRGKLMYKVIDEFGSIETIDLKTFAKRFG